MIRLAAVAALAAAAVLSATPALAASPPDHRVRSKTICTNHDWERLPSGMVLRNDDFGPGAHTCIRVTGQGFTITKSVTPTVFWNDFPDQFCGSLWGVHSRQQCGPLPEQVRDVKNLHFNLCGRTKNLNGNLSLDAWFNKTDVFQGQADQAEIMYWQSWPGNPPHNYRVVTLGGVRYDEENWREPPRMVGGVMAGWNYIQFRLAAGPRVCTENGNFRLFVTWATRHNLLKPWSWMGSIGAGFEVVKGGKGSEISDFSLNFDRETPPVLIRQPVPPPGWGSSKAVAS